MTLSGSQKIEEVSAGLKSKKSRSPDA
jgi:hypothetical protein